MTTTWVLVALVLDVGVLLSHRDLTSLRNRASVTGACLAAVGFVVLLAYWVKVEFGIFFVGRPDPCPVALGVSPADVAGAGGFRVREQFFPPSVHCGLAGRVATLTPASETHTWAAVWIAGWCALAVASLLLLAGRVRAARRRAAALSPQR